MLFFGAANPRREFIQLDGVFSTGHIVGMQNLMGLVRAGLAEVLGIDLLEHRVFMGLSNRLIGIVLVQCLSAQCFPQNCARWQAAEADRRR